MACQRYGTFSFTANGRSYSPRGAWTIRPTNKERDAAMNMDGTMFLTETPVPAEAEGSLSGMTPELMDLLTQCDGTFIFSFDQGDSYVFINGTITGRPELNMETGETSGLMVKAPRAHIQSNST